MSERIAVLERALADYQLDDSILLDAYERSEYAKTHTWHGWLLQLVRDNANLKAELAALRAAEAAMKQANDRGWYCPTCDRAVDPRHVTHTEHHDACGTFIGLAARTPKAQEGK